MQTSRVTRLLVIGLLCELLPLFGRLDALTLWPTDTDGKIVIPIFADGLDNIDRVHLTRAIEAWEMTGKVKFRRLQTSRTGCDFVAVRNFHPKNSQPTCDATVGYVGSGADLVRIGRRGIGGCVHDDFLWMDIAHEIGHVIGIDHEHQRTDRNLYIAQLPSPPGSKYLQWVKKQVTLNTVNPYGRPYGYDSIMHYPLKFPNIREFDAWDPMSKAPRDRSVLALTVLGALQFADRFPGKSSDFIGSRDRLDPVPPSDVEAVTRLHADATISRANIVKLCQ